MFVKLSVAALFVTLAAAPALAQDGLRSASLPERPIATAPAPRGPDLFRAAPDVYTPAPHRQPYFFPAVFLGGYPYYDRHQEHTVILVAPLPSAPAVPPPAPVFEPIAPRPPSAPGPPKTFYVIPRCYAGDKPPADTPVASACDVANLRIVPPGRGSR